MNIFVEQYIILSLPYLVFFFLFEGMTDFGTSLVVEEGGAQYLVPQSADYIQLVEGSNAGDGKQQLVYVMDLKSAGGGGYIVPQVGNDAVLGGVLPQVQVC